MIETYLWTKPEILARDYVLLREGAEQGRLTFDGPPSVNAHVALNGREWTLTRAGLMRPVITVRRGDTSVAEGRMRLGGGCDVAVAGRAFRWHAISVFSGEFGWEDERGAIVVRYLAAPRTTRTVQADSSLPDEVKLLLLFTGGYLLALHYNDVATMTAVLGASTAY